MVVKRARPCSWRLTPVGGPIGFSGVFSRVGSRVFSAHCFSATEGWRFSNTSASGLSTTSGLEAFFCAMPTPPQFFDDMGTAGPGQGHTAQANDRWVGQLYGPSVFLRCESSHALGYFQETYTAL